MTLSRRDLMKVSAAGLLSAPLSGWMPIMAARAAETRARSKRCILLWMDGGPSHKDTFDLRPGTENGGPYKQIQTNVNGIQISEYFPKLARVMNHGAVIRSMTTGEGAHQRAKYYLHTGYKEGVGGLVYPSIGAIASKEIGNQEAALPNFVTIGNRGFGSGFLGPRHQPLMVSSPERGVENLRSFVSNNQFQSRYNLLEELEAGFNRTHQAGIADAHRTTYQRAVKLMMDTGTKAFNLAEESEATRAAYGSSQFGQACLMARRLIESGVTFVECTLGGWDTHNNNFERVKSLSQTVDSPFSQLVIDLKDRGLLDDTLVIWMGDFGRTPKINSRGPIPGRDHYPRAWSSVMMGGGIKGGQVIGRTDEEAATVADKPVSTLDFMATVCKVLGIDHTKFNQTPIGRPVRIADRGATPIAELF